MPIDYALDRPCRLLRLTAHEDVRLDDLLVVFVRRARESAWPFGVVLDVRECPCSLSGAEMSLVVTRTRGLSAERGAPGPLAIVMPQNGAGSWMEFSRFLLTEPDQQIAVFSEVASANDWLAAASVNVSDTAEDGAPKARSGMTMEEP